MFALVLFHKPDLMKVYFCILRGFVVGCARFFPSFVLILVFWTEAFILVWLVILFGLMFGLWLGLRLGSCSCLALPLASHSLPLAWAKILPRKGSSVFSRTVIDSPVHVRLTSQTRGHVKKEMKCSGDSEILHEIVRDMYNTKIWKAWTYSCSITNYFMQYLGIPAALHFLFNAWSSQRMPHNIHAGKVNFYCC